MFRRFGFIVAAALLAAVPAAAQDVKPVQINVGGGYTGVYGAGKDHVGDGGNFTLGVIFHTKSAVSIQGEYGWNGMKQKQLSLPVYGTPGGSAGVPTDFFADANMQYGDLNVILGPHSGKTAPYAIAGLGVYYRPVTISTPGVGYATVCDPYWYVCYPALVPVENIIGKRSSTDFGMDFGAGVNFHLSDHTSFYFEARYHYIWGPEVSNTQINPLASGTTKANGQFLPITFGFRF